MILTMMVIMIKMMVMTMLSSHTQGYLVGRTTTTTGSRALTRCLGSAAVDGSVHIHNE